MKKQSIILGGLLLLALVLAGCTLGGQGSGANLSFTGGGTTASNSYGTGPTQPQCPDGTPYGKCSSTKPLFCQNGKLIPYCTKCGCDANRSCDSNSQQCVAPDFNVPFASISTVPGGTATLTTQVKNIGTGGYQGLMTHRIYICEQGQEPPCMGAIINRNYYPYPVGGFSNEIFTFGIGNGNYYAKIMADFYNNAPELKENNNIRLLYFTISDMNNDQNHLACQNLQCILVPGQGQDLCQTNADCNADLNHHLACVNQSCVSVPGQGQDLCQTNADCNASLGVDLVVNSMPHSFYPDYNATTYALDFNVLIQNIGNQTYTGPVSLFGITMWDSNSWGHGSIQYSTECYANLPPMAIKSCYFSHSTNNPAGNYNLYAYVDSNHLISELNENNNDKNVTFHIP